MPAIMIINIIIRIIIPFPYNSHVVARSTESLHIHRDYQSVRNLTNDIILISFNYMNSSYPVSIINS